jgi:hypothetical protein
METNQIVSFMDQILEQLRDGPISDNEIANGWDEKMRERYFNIMYDLKKRMESNRLTEKDKEVNLTIALDYDGILNGELSDKISKFSYWFKKKILHA